MTIERLNDEGIRFVWGQLISGEWGQRSRSTIDVLTRQDSVSQTDVMIRAGLSYQGCRETLILLIGAQLIKKVKGGYSLTDSGKRLVEIRAQEMQR